MFDVIFSPGFNSATARDLNNCSTDYCHYTELDSSDPRDLELCKTTLQSVAWGAPPPKSNYSKYKVLAFAFAG